MKRYLVFILTFTFLFGVPAVSRAEYKKTLSGVDRQTFFNNITDSLATLGKSPQEKSAMKKMRHAARRKARLEKLRVENQKKVIHR